MAFVKKMETKVVYSVVSGVEDFYLEQMEMSLFTLRFYNPSVKVVFVTDTATEESLIGNRSHILHHVDEFISVPIPEEYGKSNNFKSRFLKTSLRKYVEGNYLFIDSDTLIMSSLDEIDDFTFNIGAIPDMHVQIGKHPVKRYVESCANIVGFRIVEEDFYMNSGVFYVKDNQSTHDFYRRWHYNWKESYKKGLYPDQPSLAKTNEEFGYIITVMPGIWNCQLTTNGLKFFNDSKILHYFASSSQHNIGSPFTFYQASFYENIKKTGELSEEDKRIVLNPRTGFVDQCQIIGGTDISFLNSSIHQICISNPLFFCWLDKICNFLYRIDKKYIHKK